MDLNIQFATKDTVWYNIKTWGPPVFALLLGFFLGSMKDLLRRRREIINIRSMIHRELSSIQEQAGGWQEAFDRNIRNLPVYVGHVTEYPVYEAYIGEINRLKRKEVDAIHEAYFHLGLLKKDSKGFVEKALRGEAPSEGEVQGMTYGIRVITNRNAKALQIMEPYLRPWHRGILRKKEKQSSQTERIRRELAELPMLSDGQIAHNLGYTAIDVGHVRAEMIAAGEIPEPEIDENLIDDI